MNVKSTSSNRRSMENDLCRLKDLTEEVTQEMKIGFNSITSIDKKNNGHCGTFPCEENLELDTHHSEFCKVSLCPSRTEQPQSRTLLRLSPRH